MNKTICNCSNLQSCILSDNSLQIHCKRMSKIEGELQQCYLNSINQGVLVNKLQNIQGDDKAIQMYYIFLEYFRNYHPFIFMEIKKVFD